MESGSGVGIRPELDGAAKGLETKLRGDLRLGRPVTEWKKRKTLGLCRDCPKAMETGSNGATAFDTDLAGLAQKGFAKGRGILYNYGKRWRYEPTVRPYLHTRRDL